MFIFLAMGRKKNENNTAESKKNAGNVNFVWTNDEIELLLGVIIHFKAGKEAEGYRLGIFENRI